VLETFAGRTGFDPMKQISSVTVAFPEEARAKGELGLVLRAEKLDEARLVAYVRDELQKTGDDLVATPHGKYVLWSTKRDPSLAGFFVDGQTFVLGAGGWAPRMAELAETARPGDSAATNVDLTHLVEQAAKAHAIWAAAIVPETARRHLGRRPALRRGGVRAHADRRRRSRQGARCHRARHLTTAADARALAGKATEALRDAKRNAQVLMLGLGPYLDGVTAAPPTRPSSSKLGWERPPSTTDRPPAGVAGAGSGRRRPARISLSSSQPDEGQLRLSRRRNDDGLGRSHRLFARYRCGSSATRDLDRIAGHGGGAHHDQRVRQQPPGLRHLDLELEGPRQGQDGHLDRHVDQVDRVRDVAQERQRSE
jgi:hypothetical protein